MPSALIAQLASAATEAETLAGANFAWAGSNYAGVLGPASIAMALAATGYADSADAMLQASLAQFTIAPAAANALARDNITTDDGRTWKIVSVENDSLHVKLGLKLAV
jgi:hypothetical protein